MGNLFSPNFMQDNKVADQFFSSALSGQPTCCSVRFIDSIIHHIYTYEMFSLCVIFVAK